MTARTRFVDSIDAAPTVRLDLQASPWTTDRTSRFDPPRPKRSRISNMLVHGAQYPNNLYDDRVLNLVLTLAAADTDAAATAIQNLARELDREDGNILEYRREGQAESVFFITQPLGLEQTDILVAGAEQIIRVPIVAEPFGYGLFEDLGSFTVSNDPAAGTNPNYFDIVSANIKGDVEAPMRIKKQITGAGSFAVPFLNLWAMRRRGDPDNVPYLLQAESMTLGTDTTLPGNDPLMSGSGSNYARTSFSTTTSMALRLSKAPWPATAHEDVHGVYRVYGRFRHSVDTDTITVQLRFGGGVASIELGEIVLPATTGFRQIDLGLVQIPVGALGKTNGPSGVATAAEGLRLELWASRSGSGNLDCDFLGLVPADDRMALVEQTAGWTTSADSGLVFDSYADRVYAHRDTGDAEISGAVGQSDGDLPMLLPGVDNRIFFLGAVGPDSNGTHAIANTYTFEVGYWPAYLSIRPELT